MNYGSSSTGSNPGGGSYYNYVGSGGGSPYSPVSPYGPDYASTSSPAGGYSNSYGYWPPRGDRGSQQPESSSSSEEPKKEYGFNGDPQEEKSEESSKSEVPPSGKPHSEERLRGNDIEESHLPSSPLEDESSSSKGDEESKKYRPPLQDSLADLGGSKFNDDKREPLPNNNNNNEEYPLGPDLSLDKAQPYLNHEEWMTGSQHLQPGGGMQQFPLQMSYGGQPQQQPTTQQQMWSYYNSYPPQPQHHLQQHERFMESPWWSYGQQQPSVPQPASSGGGLQAPGAWALRGSPGGSRPSSRAGGERRGPGRPRLSASNKVPGSPGGGGDSSSSASSPSSRPRIPVSPLNTQFPSPYSSSEMSPGGGGEDHSSDGNRKRGPGRPRIGMVDPSSVVEGLNPSIGGVMDDLNHHHAHPPHPPGGIPPPPPPSGGGKSKGSSSTSSNKKRYVCEICQKRFSTAWYVRVHRKSHNGERPYICHNCGKGFMLPNVLQVHLRKCEKTANVRPEGISSPSTGLRPNVSPSGGAGGILNNNNNSHHHPHHLHHQDLRPGSPVPQHGVPYPDMYGGIYNQRFQPSQDPMGYNLHPHHHPPLPHDPLHQHHHQQHLQAMNYSNTDSVPYPNDRSPYGSPLFSPTTHFLANDRPPDKGGGIEPLFSCRSCDSVFETQSGLDDHLRSVIPCTVCDKSFNCKGDLDSHLNASHGQCPVCSERFPFKSLVTSHIKLHHEKFYLENNLNDENNDENSIHSVKRQQDEPTAGDISNIQQTPLAMS